MADPNQVRINELARELEIKAKVLIEDLPEVGVTEKKTHSSSIDNSHAELVRRHFLGLAAQEPAAEGEKVKDATAKAKPSRPPAATQPVAARPAPAASVPAAPTPATRPASGATAPAATPAKAPLPAAKPGIAPAGSEPPSRVAKPGVAPTPGSATPARPVAAGGTPGQGSTTAQRPSAAPGGYRQAGAPSSVQRYPASSGGPSGATQGRPSQGFRPAAPGQSRPGGAPGQSRPGAPRPGGPPSRFPQRPGSSRPGQDPVGGQRPGAGIPKAEPGKPLYARKPPASRGRPLIEKRYAEGERKLHPVRPRAGAGPGRATQIEQAPPVKRDPRAVTVTEGITVRELAEKLDIPAKELLKTLLDKGVFASINQALDVQTATSLAESFNGIVQVVTYEEQLVEEEKIEEGRTGSAVPRAPVVTVMGHVDHGKTSLLDAIRETEVAAGEAGGITQHIGAYQVHHGGKGVTFLDTPGHEGFTAMRARGARVTDVVVIVVAADDGVKPQTEEAIDHARAAEVPIVVAVNKIDKDGAQPERVRTEMTQHGLQPAEWGGEIEFVDVSAKTREGLDSLLDTIQVVTDLEELKANSDTEASGTVIESKLDPGRGPVVSVLIQRGTLRVGDALVAGAHFGRVRAMHDFTGARVKGASPGQPVEMLGFDGVPEAGEIVRVVENERRARQLAGERANRLKTEALARRSGRKVSLEDVFKLAQEGAVKELGLVVKADVAGSLEAIEDEIAKLPQQEVKVNIIHRGVGGINRSEERR